MPQEQMPERIWCEMEHAGFGTGEWAADKECAVKHFAEIAEYIPASRLSALAERVERARVAEEEIRGIDSVLARRPALADWKTRQEKIEFACITAGEMTDEVFALRTALTAAKERAEMLNKQVGDVALAGANREESLNATVSRLTAEVEEWKKKAAESGESMKYFERLHDKMQDMVGPLLGEIDTLRRTSVRAFSLERYIGLKAREAMREINDPSEEETGLYILEGIESIIARRIRRATTNTKGE